MSSTFRSKAQQFAQQVISDVKAVKPAEQTQEPQPKATLDQRDERIPSDNEPHAYREENRLSEFGKKKLK